MNIETAGSRLKKIRQERGLTLEDVQKKTRIHLNVLRAIEGDSISNLSPIYLKGFIKIYCSYLGLDQKDFIGVTAPASKPALNATVGRPIGARIERKSSSFVKEVSVKLGAIKPFFDFKKIFVLGAILVVIFLGINLVKFISGRAKAVKTSLGKAKVTLPAAAANAPAKTAVSVQNKAASKDLAQGFTLGIFARGKSWISAKVDGKVVFHGVLARGRSETWQVREKVELSLGNAGAVELQLNDQRFTNLGRSGQSLKNVIINKDGLKISR
jgi:cytoskeletal protein RodZ